ncbi:MAG: hypothetical protein ACYC5K_08490 [Saccharofermentanales bacterium]
MTIPLKALDIYDVGLHAVLQITGSRGLSATDIQMLDAANNLPDIFLMHDQLAFVNDDIAPADLNSSYADRYITPGNVYPTMFFDSVSDDALFTIPLYASVKMIYANRSLFDSSALKDSSTLRSPLSINTIQTLSKQITSPADGIYGFMGFSELLAFMPSAASPFPQSFMWSDGAFDFRNQAFADSVALLSGFAAEQSSVDSLTDVQKLTLYGTSDPRTINKIAFWIDDSDSLSEWSGSAKVERYPLPVIDRLSIPMTVYSVSVNARSTMRNDAIKLASYISLDRDALLFRSRYNINEGYIPPLRDQLVWDNLVAPQKQGNELFILRSAMESSHAIDGYSKDKAADIFDYLYVNYFRGILFDNRSLEDNLGNIESEAQYLLSGG